MATLTAVNPRVYKGHMETVTRTIKSGQTWKAGQWLSVSSGLLIAAADQSEDVSYVAIVDLDTDPGNSTTTANVGVITNDIIFVANTKSGSATVAMEGEIYEIDVTSNVLTVDTGATSQPCVEIVGRMSVDEPLRNSAADTLARVQIRVLQSVLDK